MATVGFGQDYLTLHYTTRNLFTPDIDLIITDSTLHYTTPHNVIITPHSLPHYATQHYTTLHKRTNQTED